MVRRRLWRIVGVLALTTAIGAAGYGWVVAIRRHRALEASNARMEAWGGRTHRELNREGILEPFRRQLGPQVVDLFTGSDGNQVGAWGTKATPAQLAEALESEPLRSVFFGGAANLGDNWVAGLRRPESLFYIHLEGTAITDRSIDKFEQMTNLAFLAVVDTALSDASLNRLLKLPRLHRLHFGGPNLRAIRLADHRVLDESGQPAVRAGGVLRVEGRIEMPCLNGEAGQVRVFVRPPGDPLPWESIPYGWNARLGEVVRIEKAKDGAWTFQAGISGVPEGRSTVEVWVDYRPTPEVDGERAIIRKDCRFRLEPFSIELAPPRPGSIEWKPAGGRGSTER